MSVGSALERGQRRSRRDDEHVRVGEELDRLVRARRRPGGSRTSGRARRARSSRAARSRPATRGARSRRCGWLSEKRRRSVGMIRAPTLWNVPTRSRPASPASSAPCPPWRPAAAPGSRRRGAAGSGPASVSEIGRGPPGPLDQPQPDDALERRDLLRDRRLRVAETLRRPPERALVGDRLERDEMAQVEPEPAIRFHDRSVPTEHTNRAIGGCGATLRA